MGPGRVERRTLFKTRGRVSEVRSVGSGPPGSSCSTSAMPSTPVAAPCLAVAMRYDPTRGRLCWRAKQHVNHQSFFFFGIVLRGDMVFAHSRCTKVGQQKTLPGGEVLH